MSSVGKRFIASAMFWSAWFPYDCCSEVEQYVVCLASSVDLFFASVLEFQQSEEGDDDAEDLQGRDCQ